MLRYVILLMLATPALAAERFPLCTVSAITRPLPGAVRFEVDLKQPGEVKSVPLRRVRSLPEAIHFVLEERRHYTCRPAFPAERRFCSFSVFNRQILMSYASPGTAAEPLAVFPDQAHAGIALRQMRNAFLCN